MCGYCAERPICVDIVMRDQSVLILRWETNVCRYCGERPICVDIAVRDQSVWLSQ